MADNQPEQAQPNDGPSYAPSVKTVTIKIDDIPIVRIMLLTEFSPRVAKIHLIAQRPLPGAKMPELVAALRELDGLPNRAAQLQALCNMPEFREFKITNALFREAARHVPREAGRRSPRES
jgi:hypothetical protein